MKTTLSVTSGAGPTRYYLEGSRVNKAVWSEKVSTGRIVERTIRERLKEVKSGIFVPRTTTRLVVEL